MTQNQFAALCNQYGIHPSIALENDDLRQALKDRNDKKVIEILTNEF
jgi:2-succinyl-5-enolpyruvyl-6-hydroxy-3-cyclohexene-1-carboxylate synthase